MEIQKTIEYIRKTMQTAARQYVGRPDKVARVKWLGMGSAETLEMRKQMEAKDELPGK